MDKKERKDFMGPNNDNDFFIRALLESAVQSIGEEIEEKSMTEGADELYSHFKVLMDAGFTRKEAFQLFVLFVRKGLLND